MITSKDNSRVKHARNVREGRVRNEIFVEGLRLCEEVLKANLEIVDVLFTADLFENPRGSELISNFPSSAEVSDKIFATISDTKTPQGICIIAKRPQNNLQTVDNKRLRLRRVFQIRLFQMSSQESRVESREI